VPEYTSSHRRFIDLKCGLSGSLTSVTSQEMDFQTVVGRKGCELSAKMLLIVGGHSLVSAPNYVGANGGGSWR